MSKNDKPTSLDYTNAITSSHNEKEKSLNVITANSLIPIRFGKVEVDYYESGIGAGCVSQARYFSNGSYQETKIITKGDKLGSAHKTTVSFINKKPEELGGRAFVIHDDIGAVKVWFNLDFSNDEPNLENTYRSIQVNILSSHTHETIANRTALAIDLDSSFLAIHSMYYIIISSNTVGVKPDSYSFNASLPIKNTPGTEAASLNGKHFLINSALNSEKYYVWYNVNGTGVDPLVSERTGIMVAIPSGCKASVVAQNTGIALSNTGKFITNIDEDTLVVTNALIGATDLSADVNTGFLVFVQTFGKSRELIATLIMTYNEAGHISSVERL
jgi:hypothetical protein